MAVRNEVVRRPAGRSTSIARVARVALVVVALAALLGACSSSGSAPDVTLPDNIKLPTDPGGSCDDPVGDIGADVAAGSGSLSEPAGIDIVKAESKVVDGVLQSSFTMAGPVVSAPGPTLFIDQGTPGQEVSFELRASPAGGNAANQWAITLVTWKNNGQGKIEERSAPLFGQKVVVQDKTVSFDIPTKDLPTIVTLLWNFGSTSGEGDATLLDDCNSASTQTPGSAPTGAAAPGSSTTTTALPAATLGTEQPFKTSSKVTVYEVQDPVQGGKTLTIKPEEGQKLVVVDAQVCATDSRIMVRTDFFNVKLVTNQLYPPWPQPQAAKDPAFPTNTTLGPGECIRGWITFAIAFSGQVGSVSYSGASNASDPIIWKV